MIKIIKLTYFFKEVGYFKRLVLKSIKPDMEISNDGKKWKLQMTSTFKNTLQEFTEGEAFYSRNVDNFIFTNLFFSNMHSYLFSLF